MGEGRTATGTPQVFGTDGVRGVAGQGALSPENVSRLAHALVGFAAARSSGRARLRVLLARDPRPSGDALTNRLAGHMAAAGAEVVDAGVLPSPALAWLTAEGDYDLGCSISASHNTHEYNGIKPFVEGGRKLTIDEELAIEAAMPAEAPVVPPLDLAHDASLRERYVEATSASLARGGRLDGHALVVDLSAGAASETAAAVLERLGATVRILNEAGTRPINEDCGSEHPEAWLAAVAATPGTMGLAFDGDADRVIVADETGEALDGDDLLAVMAMDLAARGGVPGKTVVATVMSNLGLEELLAGLGTRLERTPVGDRNVAERMRALGAVLGGEPAGHVVLPREDAGTDPILVGDGLVAGVRVLQAARRLGEPLSALRARRVRHPQTLVNVRMGVRRPLGDWPAFARELAVQEAALAGTGRLVVRYSGTEPLLRIMAEGRDRGQVVAAVEALAKVARR
jgi:phosphoglucosamine mutase